MPKKVSEVKELRSNTITARLERQIDRVLDDLENLPIGPRERVQALYTIGRIQVIFNTLAKGQRGDSGSAVRKYSQAFAHAGGRRASHTRPAIVDAPDGLDDDDDIVA